MDFQPSTSGPSAPADLPVLGFRNYWYPVKAARELKEQPVAVRVLGEDIVIFRSEGNKAAALASRCPRCGTSLALGHSFTPGTLTCSYDGWTFNTDGEYVGGVAPDSEAVASDVRIRAFPAEERFGIIWLFVGEAKPPPLEEDLPPEAHEPGVLTHFTFTLWRCNWRNIIENYADILHAPFVHRTALEVIFNKVPAWGRVHLEPLPDGKGMHVRGAGGGMQGDYPGLGKFPRRFWWRVLRRRYKKKEWSGASTAGGDVRMPGYILVKVRDPYWGVHIANMGRPTPIDEQTTLHLNFLVTYPKNFMHALALKIWYNLYFRHIHFYFLRQDRRLLEVQTYRDPESLSTTDVGVVQWRHLAQRLARKPQ